MRKVIIVVAAALLLAGCNRGAVPRCRPGRQRQVMFRPRPGTDGLHVHGPGTGTDRGPVGPGQAVHELVSTTLGVGASRAGCADWWSRGKAGVMTTAMAMAARGPKS